MSSLQDQLLKAGLVDKKQAKKVQKEKRKVDKVRHKSKQPDTDENKLQAQEVLSQKKQRDRELNQQLQKESERKAIAAQIRQLIKLNRLPKHGEVAYNFTDEKKIKKIYVTEKISEQISRGLLCVVKLNEAYELIPAAVADKIRQRDDSVIVVQHESTQEDEDDPYADYQIPDDLMW